MAKKPAAAEVEALKRQLAELQAQLAARGAAPEAAAQSGSRPQAHIHTQGGAAVQGSVDVRSGHFIGRDFVQYITQISQAGDDPQEVKSVIAHYLNTLAGDLSGLKLGEIDAATDQARHTPLQLADIYVPLDTTLQIDAGSTLAQWLAQEKQPQREAAGAHREARPVAALEALAQHRQLTVLGKPGSGKSTFGASVLLALAQTWQGHADELARLGPAWPHGPLLPIRVVLRRFAQQLAATDAPARAGDLWEFIGKDLDAGGHGLSGDTMKYVKRIARTHGALVLFDGLDECGTPARRDRVLAAVNEFIAHSGKASRFILTARPYAWPAGPDPGQGVYALADLNDEQIEQFIRSWYAALVQRAWRTPGDAQRKIDDLLRARQGRDLRPLTGNPLLLTLMAALHTNRGGLPEDRADLYNESVELLMLRWNRQIGADKALLDELAIPGLQMRNLRRVLEQLAFDIHEQSVGREGAADIGEDRLVRAFRPLLADSRDKAQVVVEYIEKRAGLLLGQGEKDGERQFSFPHRTFQEFLAACHLSSRKSFAADCVRLARADSAHWFVVLPLAARLAEAERGAAAADALIGGRSHSDASARQPITAADWQCALHAAAQLKEIGMASIKAGLDSTLAISERVSTWLIACLPLHPEQGGLAAEARAHAGDLLAAMRDPRFDAQRLCLPADALLGFVHIEADPVFRLGTRTADLERIQQAAGIDIDPDADEINDEALSPTPDFFMARYPVTVAQFRAYLEAENLQPVDINISRDPENRPVRNVGWREAKAYCQWLTSRLAEAPEFDGSEPARLVRDLGWWVDLPNEPEWEKAARGGLDGVVFSWGDMPDPQRANCTDSGVDDTSAVGCFPANAFALHDMLGNVWEWTRSVYGKYPYPTDDLRREASDTADNSFKVVRGGSWIFHRDDARCAYRNWNLPDGRDLFLGFRVVLRSSPVSKR